MVCNEFVGHCARKTTVPAFRVKAEQVIAIGVSLADPQFADHAAIRQRLVHIVSPIVTSRCFRASWRARRESHPQYICCIATIIRRQPSERGPLLLKMHS